jgi:hypothetical protein
LDLTVRRKTLFGCRETVSERRETRRGGTPPLS